MLSNESIAQFCREMAVLLHGGVSLAEGVRLLAAEEGWKAMEVLSGRLEEGSSLSEAMEVTGAFPRAVWAMAAIGEKTGHLEETLDALAEYYRERCRVEHRIRMELTYPGLIAVLMLAVITALLVFVLPVFEQVYASLGRPMTGLAGGLLGMGKWLKTALPGIGIGLLLPVGLLATARYSGLTCRVRQQYIRRYGDRGIARRFCNARFARALALGLGSGLPVEEAMALAGELMADIPGAAERCNRCLQLLRQGETLDKAMAETDFLAPAQSRLLMVGLRCGSVDRVMRELAEKRMEEAQEALEKRLAALEPALVLVTSLLVGLILLAVMLPLLELLAGIG